MKQVLLSFSVVILLGFFYSCQKETSATSNNRNNGVQSDSIYLDRIIILDTTQPTGSDTTEIAVFFYDNQKRLTRIRSIYNGDDSTIFDFYYSGTDTLPGKQRIKEVFFGSTYIDTTYYFYSNGVVIKDSLVSWKISSGLNLGAEVTEFSTSGSTLNILKKHYDYISGTYVLSGTDQGSVSVSIAGGNLISQNRINGDAAYFDMVQASYDTKLNPFSKVIKIKYPLLESPYFDCSILQRNNPIQVQFQEPLNSPVTETSSYIYRSDNYPIQRNYSSTYGDFNKALYFYKAL